MRRPPEPERALRRAWVGNRVVFFILMQASDPSSGYLSDVTFPDRFHRELSPTWLNYASVLGGARPKGSAGRSATSISAAASRIRP